MKKTLWTRNFTLVTAATAMGSAGAIFAGFALSFLVFDETGSTFASALILAIQWVPGFLIPLAMAPVMDRLPRNPFLVGGDVINGILYALAGLFLLKYEFTYRGYLVFSLILASLGAFDQLAYDSIYPKLIPEGMEEKGYSPLLIAGFRTIPGLTAAMYSLFSVAEFLGRSIGGTVRYTTEMPKEKKFGFTFAFICFMRRWT